MATVQIETIIDVCSIRSFKDKMGRVIESRRFVSKIKSLMIDVPL